MIKKIVMCFALPALCAFQGCGTEFPTDGDLLTDANAQVNQESTMLAELSSEEYAGKGLRGCGIALSDSSGNTPGNASSSTPCEVFEDSFTEQSSLAAKNPTAALFAFYSVKKNYDAVFKEVLSFHKSGRANGCVAFMSSALRQSGTAVPKNKTIGGYNVSLVTTAFSQYLKTNLGWKKISNSSALQQGDVVFTESEPEWPGVPAHTYMFHSWKDKANGIGWVIDNQNFTHVRNVYGRGSHNFTPFAYALRAN